MSKWNLTPPLNSHVSITSKSVGRYLQKVCVGIAFPFISSTHVLYSSVQRLSSAWFFSFLQCFRHANFSIEKCLANCFIIYIEKHHCVSNYHCTTNAQCHHNQSYARLFSLFQLPNSLHYLCAASDMIAVLLICSGEIHLLFVILSLILHKSLGSGVICRRDKTTDPALKQGGSSEAVFKLSQCLPSCLSNIYHI